MDQRTLVMHQVMLSDRVRLDAYDAALRRTLRPGDVVVDVGAGTLALSLLALRRGARHVYAIEADPHVAALASVIAERNRLLGRLTVIQGDARSVVLPEPADLLVSEMMGNLGPEEEMAEVVGCVARRNLKPSGRVVPARVVTQFQAVQFDGEGWGVWSDFFGYTLSPVQEHAPSAAQLHFFAREPVQLSAPAIAADQDLVVGQQRQQQRLRLDIVASGTLHAVIGYFTATLVDGLTLSNLPSYPGCNWAVWVWPVRHTSVRPGMVVEATLRHPRRVRVATDWHLDCRIRRSQVAPAEPAPAGRPGSTA